MFCDEKAILNLIMLKQHFYVNNHFRSKNHSISLMLQPNFWIFNVLASKIFTSFFPWDCAHSGSHKEIEFEEGLKPVFHCYCPSFPIFLVFNRLLDFRKPSVKLIYYLKQEYNQNFAHQKSGLFNHVSLSKKNSSFYIRWKA